jgi:hypothetical protein
MAVSIRNETQTNFLYSFELVNDPNLHVYIREEWLEPGASSGLYGSSEVSRDPIALFRQAYTELTIVLQDEDSIRLSFRPDSAENYVLNPFTDSAAWTLRIEEDIQDGPVTIWNYEFIIREELIER